MILVDTSVWVDPFKNRNQDLVWLLLSDSALIHPLIIAELTCGTPPAHSSDFVSLIGPLDILSFFQYRDRIGITKRLINPVDQRK